MFRYLWLSDLAQLDVYITETRLQASQSFNLARLTAAGGFVVLIGAVLLAMSSAKPEVTGIIAGAGALTQFMSGVILVLYARTIAVFNDFDERLEASRRLCISLFLTSKMDDTMKHKTWQDLIMHLASAGSHGAFTSSLGVTQADDVRQPQSTQT